MSETELLWTIVALGYSVAGVYLRAFDGRHHPTRVWLPFLAVGGAIFLLINGSYFWGPETRTALYIEYIAIIAVAAAGGGLFHMALDYTRQRERLEAIKNRHDNQTTFDDHND